MNDAAGKDKTYRLGAYVAYPLLAAVGAVLLSRADSAGAIAVAVAVLAGVLILSAFLGRYCRRCGERFLPRLLRLLIMPVSVMTALGLRTRQLPGQYIAFFMVGVSAVMFGLAWQMSAPAVPVIKTKRGPPWPTRSGSTSGQSRNSKNARLVR